MANKQPTFGNGKICYIEIPADDIDSAANFYQKTFGWEVRKRDDGSVAFDDGVGEVSGTWVLGRKPATEIGFVISIMVSDILATIDLITSNGGKIIQAANMNAREKVARFADPYGNIFGLYQHRF